MKPEKKINNKPMPTKEEIIELIRTQIAVQPDDIDLYRFDEPLEVKAIDGNYFKCYALTRNTSVNFKAWLYSDITGEFYTHLDNLETDSLELISDSIQPPRTIMVTFQCYKDDSEGAPIDTLDFPIHTKNVLHDFTEEQLLDYLRRYFPLFDWQKDDADQFVYYPDPDNTKHYFLANCYRDSYYEE